jgi:hypothetical protein
MRKLIFLESQWRQLNVIVVDLSLISYKTKISFDDLKSHLQKGTKDIFKTDAEVKLETSFPTHVVKKLLFFSLFYLVFHQF